MLFIRYYALLLLYNKSRLLVGQSNKKRNNQKEKEQKEVEPVLWEGELMSESQLTTLLNSFQSQPIGSSPSSTILMPSGGMIDNVPDVLMQAPSSTVDLYRAYGGVYKFLDPSHMVEVPRIFPGQTQPLFVATNECIIQSALRYNWSEHPW